MNVLVIDDDPAMTELLKIQLQSDTVTVDIAYSGEEGIKMVRKTGPDIIILDLLMPELDGWQTCKRIREFTQTPILILSALDNPGLVANALDAGADDYLVKPVSSNMLNVHLKNLTRRNHAKKDALRSITV
jgi:two-component system KDP operon response regulator KdpE